MLLPLLLSALLASLTSPTAAQPAYASLSPAGLSEATHGHCAYLEGAFTETFAALNGSRWLNSSTSGLFHCARERLAGAPADKQCTMALPDNLVFNAPLPFRRDGAHGAALTVARSPCAVTGRCCEHGHCANFSGAHLVSRGCLFFGSLTAELSVRIPQESRAFWDVGTYVKGGLPGDEATNELDSILEISPTGLLAYHASFFAPAEHKRSFDATTRPAFSAAFAAGYHNYTVTWTPSSIAWSVDGAVYRNTSTEPALQGAPIPWRPMTMRLVFRTTNGTVGPRNAYTPEAHVYIAALRYTPLPPPPPPSLRAQVAGALRPGQPGPLRWSRLGVAAVAWVVGSYQLRDARADAARDAAAVAGDRGGELRPDTPLQELRRRPAGYGAT